ncbi:MAG: aspartate aminotransferase family protein [Nocardioidaceae bacterium]
MKTAPDSTAPSIREATTALWHPFSDMATVRQAEFVVDRAQDVWVYDTGGDRFLDATASLWYVNIGHGRQEVASAVAEQMRRLSAYSTFGDYANEPARALARRLASLAPMPDAKVFLTSGGGDSVETAVKLARLYWSAKGKPDRTHVITRSNSYHGTHGIGTSVAGITPNRDGFGELVPGTSRIPYDSVDALREEIERVGPERVAAFVFEPVLGAGGVYLPPEGYIPAVVDVCREYGVLVVADSVICGFGRLGTWFGVERWDVVPDMVVFAKGVTSGYLPLGGVVVHRDIAAPFWEEPGRPFRHGPTYAGHPACCAAALANLDILEREGLVERGRLLEQDLAAALRPLRDHSLVAEVRAGLGLLAAVELSPEVLADEPRAISRLQGLIRENGVLVRPLGTSVALSPPLTIQQEHLGLIVDAARAALDDLAKALAA